LNVTAPLAKQGGIFLVEFDPTALIEGLTILEKVQLPFIASLTINRSLEQIKSEIRDNMRETFNYFAPYTKNSLYSTASQYNAETIESEIGFKQYSPKGNSAADYLAPQERGGSVYRTRFQRRLADKGFMPQGSYMLPLLNSPAANLNGQGRISNGQYVQALYGISAMNDVKAGPGTRNYQTQGSYLNVPGAGKVFRNGKMLMPGIYKVNGKNYTMVWKQVQKVPTVPRKFMWPDVGEAIAGQILPKTFESVFREVIG
jgi:hypothetical protein